MSGTPTQVEQGGGVDVFLEEKHQWNVNAPLCRALSARFFQSHVAHPDGSVSPSSSVPVQTRAGLCVPGGGLASL